MKVNFLGKDHSLGRGVGFYTSNLSKALEANGVVLTDKDPDLTHYPFFDLFYPTLPISQSQPTVVTIHDLTPLVLPNLYPQGLRSKLNLFHQAYSVSQKSAIITDSNSSRKDLIRHFHLKDNQIFVAPLAVDPLYNTTSSMTTLKKIQKIYSLPTRFILYVGGANPNKNLLSLVKACHQNKIPLVLVGSEFTKDPSKTFSFKSLIGLQNIHPEAKTLHMVRKLIDGQKVLALGFVPTEDLVSIYKLASLAVSPALYEGFGIPLLEAMTAKCLSLSSNNSSLRELATDRMLTFDPYDQESLGKAISIALGISKSKKEQIITSAYNKSMEYSWDQTAKRTIAVYQAVLNKR